MALIEYCNLQANINNRPFQRETEELTENIERIGLSDPMHLVLPRQGNPVDLLKEFSHSESGKPIKFDFHHGTTTLGFIYKGGVIVAVDSRATGGQYIASQTTQKVIMINDYMIGTLAGGAADCQYWYRVLSKQCRIYELRNRERISVAAASKLMINMIYSYKGMGLSMGVILAGYDKRGPSLYYLDNDGKRTAGNIFSVGSGSIYAYGVLDSGYHFNLTDEEAYELARSSIMHATHRDAYSGGVVQVYHVTTDGWKQISKTDASELYYNRKTMNI